MNKLQTTLSLTILLFLCTSCFKDSNFEFEVPETETIVTTSKRKNSKFFIFFTEKGTPVQTEPLSEVDYVEIETMDSPAEFIFDPNNPRNIHFISNVYILSKNEVKYSFDEFDLYKKEVADTTFYELNSNAERILKEPYKELRIDLMHYSIYLNDETLKKGGLLGGW